MGGSGVGASLSVDGCFGGGVAEGALQARRRSLEKLSQRLLGLRTGDAVDAARFNFTPPPLCFLQLAALLALHSQHNTHSPYSVPLNPPTVSHPLSLSRSLSRTETRIAPSLRRALPKHPRSVG